MLEYCCLKRLRGGFFKLQNVPVNKARLRRMSHCQLWTYIWSIVTMQEYKFIHKIIDPRWGNNSTNHYYLNIKLITAIGRNVYFARYGPSRARAQRLLMTWSSAKGLKVFSENHMYPELIKVISYMSELGCLEMVLFLNNAIENFWPLN